MSCGKDETGETPQALAPRRLSVEPAEREQISQKSIHHIGILNIMV
jgi:hypothetical protein